jgi:hypothetical protein
MYLQLGIHTADSENEEVTVKRYPQNAEEISTTAAKQ